MNTTSTLLNFFAIQSSTVYGKSLNVIVCIAGDLCIL